VDTNEWTVEVVYCKVSNCVPLKFSSQGDTTAAQ